MGETPYPRSGLTPRRSTARYPVGPMFDTGYWTIGRVRGAPIRVHWSAPIGALVFTGFSFSPALWLGFLFLVVWHELGHAAIVWKLGYRVVGMRVHAFGGDCSWSGDPTRADDAAVAWGGVLAQAVLGVGALIAILIGGWPTTPVLAALAVTFTSTNVRMIIFNLMPIPPLDGYTAWRLLPMLWEARKERIAYQRARADRRRAKDQELVRERARSAVRREVTAVDVPEEDLAPLPDEVKAVLERVMKGDAKTSRRR
jgi:stage IV sporulation protein FB